LVKRNELWLTNAKIAPYGRSTHVKLPIDRERKLLLHKNEINRIIEKYHNEDLFLN